MNPPDFSSCALVLLGHGSTKNPDSGAPTRRHAETIRQRGVFSEVTCGFWKETPSLRDALEATRSRRVFVVPNFISDGYFTRDVIPRVLELDGPLTRWHDGRMIHYCHPTGSHPLMTDLLIQRASEAAADFPLPETTLLIAGHGTPRSKHSAVAIRDQAEKIGARGIYGQVEAVFMEEPPLIGDWERIAQWPHVAVVPFFIADGFHSAWEIPPLLGIPAEKRATTHHIRGKWIRYAGSLGSEPCFADIIIELAAQSASQSL